MQDVILIGRGNVGGVLDAALQRAGCRVAVVTRDDGWDTACDTSDTRPRIVAVGEKDLTGVLHRLPAQLRERTMLVQNGFLEAVHGDLGPVSRGLIWFMSKGDFFAELAPSLFHGAVAAPIVEALAAGGLDVREIDDASEFTRQMIVKGVWNSVVGLPLACHGVDLATYVERHADELRELVREGVEAGSAQYGVSVSLDEALSALLSTLPPIGWVKGGIKALDYRNGAIAHFGRRHGVATEVTDRLLQQARST